MSCHNKVRESINFRSNLVVILCSKATKLAVISSQQIWIESERCEGKVYWRYAKKV